MDCNDNSNFMTKSVLSIALFYLVTSAFTCFKVRDLKQINQTSAEKNLLQVQGWSLGEDTLTFDFALSTTDSLQRELLSDPKLTRIQLSIDKASYQEDGTLFLNGRRRTFPGKTKKANEELIAFSFRSNNTYLQIKKNNYPIALTVEAGNGKKIYTFVFK